MGYTLYEQPHKEMCAFFESMLPPPPDQMQEAEQQYGMYLAPRETLKTSIGAQGLAEYFLVKFKQKYNYDGRVLLVRSSHEAAKTVSGAISEDFSNSNPVLQLAFGDLSNGSVRWKADALVLNWRDIVYREPSIDTAGSGMSKTGFHFDMIIIDDIANEKNFESEIEMKQAIRYIQACMPILNSWGSMVVIGTRWGHNDPYGWILQKNEAAREENDQRKKEGKPELPLPWRVEIHSCYNEDGTLFYPTYLSEKNINQKRRGMEEKMFTACYLNQVIQDASKVFKPDGLRFYDGLYTPDDGDEYSTLEVTEGAHKGLKVPVRATMHIDPASTATGTSNFTAIAFVLTDPDGNMWVHDSWKGKEAPSEIRSRIVAMARYNAPKDLSIDTLGQQVLWVDAIESDLKEAGIKCAVKLHKGKALKDGKITTGIRTKASRIESLEPWFREGRIFLRRGHCSAIVNEYNFYDGPTHTNHFDMLDALAQAPVFAKRPEPNRVHEDMEDKEWELEFGEDEPAKRKVKGSWAGR